MSLESRIGTALIDLQIVTADQWKKVCAAHPPSNWKAILEDLKSQPSWWAPKSEPALTEYQLRRILQILREGEPEQLPKRLRLGDYLILSQVGQGGMGLVFKAWDLTRHRLVALKRVRKASEEIRMRFRREAHLLSRLDHPGIARFFELIDVHGSDVLVMEYVSGKTLEDHVHELILNKQGLPWGRLLVWTAQILDALDHAHQRYVIHRDIKPSNILILDNGEDQIKILDMGLAKCTEHGPPTEEDDQGVGESHYGLTQTGQVLGTGEYVSPESLRGKDRVVPESDIYSLGITLFYALTGRPPFREDRLKDLFLAHLKNPPPSVRQRRPDVPDDVDMLVLQMLAKEPRKRGTAQKLKLRCEEILKAAPKIAFKPVKAIRKTDSSSSHPLMNSPARETARANPQTKAEPVPQTSAPAPVPAPPPAPAPAPQSPASQPSPSAVPQPPSPQALHPSVPPPPPPPEYLAGRALPPNASESAAGGVAVNALEQPNQPQGENGSPPAAGHILQQHVSDPASGQIPQQRSAGKDGQFTEVKLGDVLRMLWDKLRSPAGIVSIVVVSLLLVGLGVFIALSW